VSEANVTDKPILFSAPMVRAILAGRKTQTRRLVRPQPAPDAKGLLWWHLSRYEKVANHEHEIPESVLERESKRYVDRLWVKETSYIAPVGFGDRDLCNATDYDGQRRVVGYLASMDGDSERCATDYGVKKSPAIFMPRWASRITLDITDVRIERLWKLDKAAVIAEGAVSGSHNDLPVSAFDGKVYLDLCSLFAAGWDSINAKRATWDSNPWVCVVTFKRANVASV
jgi:hypothetical protein